MKLAYTKPIVQIELFESRDVITASPSDGLGFIPDNWWIEG